MSSNEPSPEDFPKPPPKPVLPQEEFTEPLDNSALEEGEFFLPMPTQPIHRRGRRKVDTSSQELWDFNEGDESDNEADAPSGPFPLTSARRSAFRSRSRRSTEPLSPRFTASINTALGLNPDGTGTMSLNATNGSFPNFLQDAPNINNGNGMQRQAPGLNGGGGNAAMAGNGHMVGQAMPMGSGQQMDLNMMYQKLMELSEVLKENREKTQGIVTGAEELATRAAATGASSSLQEANHEVSAARIADLTCQVNQLQHVKQILLREQRENTKLIGEYETAVGNIVEQIRNFAYAKDMEKSQVSREYNKLLQDEKDAHLATRLERDDWHAKFMRSVEMIRTAYRLRCEEEDVPLRIVAGLQNEVRAYRNALGMEPEKFEDEFGYEILKDVVNGAGEP